MNKQESQTEIKVIESIKHHELDFFKSIGWVTLVVSFLYLCGYFWRTCYYYHLGIPVFFIDYPFPEIIVPQLHLVSFLVQCFLTYAYMQYNDYYVREKRLIRSNSIGLDDPIEDVHQYAWQKNINEPDKTNFSVLIEAFGKYIQELTQSDSAEKFDVENFKRNTTKQFQDIPEGLIDSFVRYSLRMALDKTQRKGILEDAVGFTPRGSIVYQRVTNVALWVSMLLILGGVFILKQYENVWTLISMFLGVVMGLFLYKISKTPARWQIWHSILIFVVVAVAFQAVHGSFKARSDINAGIFPLAKINQINGHEQKGLLIGNFSDCYILLVSDNGVYNHKIILKQSVESLGYTTKRTLENRAHDIITEKMKEIEEIGKELDSDVKKLESML